MKFTDAVYEAFENIAGIGRAELDEDPEFDLVENGILDSLIVMSILTYLEEHFGYALDIKKISGNDLVTFPRFLAALQKQVA